MQLFRQFRSRPLQSVLIILAVALGVAVITAVAAFLEIGSAGVREFAESVEGRKITITPKANDWGAFYEGGVANPVVKIGNAEDEPVVFSVTDIEKARTAAPSVDYAYTEVAQATIASVGTMAFLDAVGITPDYLEANEIKLSSGSVFLQDDYDQKKSVALVRPRLIKAADLKGEPIGQSIEGFQIVGVLEETEEANLYIPNMLIPFPANPFNPVDTLTFVVKDAAKLDEARAQLEAFAYATWGDRVTVRAPNSNSYDVQARAANFIVAVLASVGLVIAGLNIMNLMTARVLEQQKNIGVLRSIGASRADIRGHYLFDSLTFGGIGGVLGILFGWLLVFVFNRYIQIASPEMAESLQIQLSPLAVVIGFIMACLLSTLFALYPAMLASRTNIINALKEL
jgi:putative ABC transport system permease protein